MKTSTIFPTNEPDLPGPKMMFDSLVCPLSSDQDTETEAARDSFEIFKGSTKSLCDEVLMTKT